MTVASLHRLNRYCTSQNVANAVTALGVYFQGSSIRVYTLNWSTNLVSGSWTNVPEQINVKGNGPSTSLIDTNAADLRFYEVEVRVP